LVASNLSGLTQQNQPFLSDWHYRLFDEIDIPRTPYRIDILQVACYVRHNQGQLFQLNHKDLSSQVRKVRTLGLEAAKFERDSA